ncbi:hypothetical protein lerEdw1_020054 [Lerista edwardsae]|nr:hypothetical protein lerEdw1_020054 [Lerista edwardsae]
MWADRRGSAPATPATENKLIPRCLAGFNNSKTVLEADGPSLTPREKKPYHGHIVRRGSAQRNLNSISKGVIG